MGFWRSLVDALPKRHYNKHIDSNKQEQHMKAILLVALGAIGYHFYANASDRDQLIYTVKSTVSNTAADIADTTKPDLMDVLKNR
jgi:hypothetical protein